MNANNLKQQQQNFHNIANKIAKKVNHLPIYNNQKTVELLHKISVDYKMALKELEKCKTQL